MGAKPSKDIIDLDDDTNSRAIHSRSMNNDSSSHRHYYQRKTRHLKQVLTPKNRKKQVVVTSKAVAVLANDTPISCTTHHTLPDETTVKQQQQQQSESNYIITKRSSLPRHGSHSFRDPMRSKKLRKAAHSPSVMGIAARHASIINHNTTPPSDYYSNKSSISSGGWTTLSNDPFSQIEADTSAFTEITDQSTISRKSLYPVLESSEPIAPSSTTTKVPAISTLNMLATLENHPQQSHHLILKEAYQRAQQQNDEYDWHQFYNAVHQYIALPSSYKSIGIVYLAKCLVLGSGVSVNIERGLNLLKSHPSCETTYALGRCYLDGYSNSKEIQGVDKLVAAFECFKTASEYDAINDSVLSTIGESQCTLARMLFQGEGVDQNTQEALAYLMKSAENNNMYAQFLIGVHYERGFDMAQDLEKAKHYYGKSADGGFPDAQAALGSRFIAEAKYAQGIVWLEKAAQMGNSRAHVQLGILYDKGQGVQQNNDMALLHYKAAVENNNHAAQYILGLVYYFGRLGKEKNHQEAIRLIKQSAMAGLPYAQRVLGQLYQQGSILSSSSSSHDSAADDRRLWMKQNEREAIRWYKRAVTGNDVCAMGILGKCYQHGIGVDVDLEKALAFYAEAAKGDSPYVCHAYIDQALLLQKLARHTEAFRLYNLVVENGVPAKDKLAIETATLSVARYRLCRDIHHVDYNPVLAHSMLQNLVETTNNPHAHYWLGSIYDEGIPGVFNIDRQKAFHHFLIAADAGDNDATFLVAYMMSNHVIPLKGPVDAFPWYQKAAIKGHAMSMYSLGLCYYKGIAQQGNQPQLDTALEWFEKSARLGVTESMAYMARIYLQCMMMANADQPQLAQQHFVKAVQWLEKSAEKNDTYAQRELGKIYLTGKGRTTDYRMAVELLGKAAAKNDGEAITFLGDCYHKGTGVDKNMEIAIEHYSRAAALGYPYAYSATAELYYEMGHMELAYDFYILASKETKIAHNKIGQTARMMVARLALGYIPCAEQVQSLVNSNKTIITAEAAFDMLSTLAIQDQFPQAFQPLGCCYLYGTGTLVNPLQAVFWFRRSAQELDDSAAYFKLADIYGSGLEPGVQADIPLALSCLNKSADMGFTEAQYRMGMIHLEGGHGVGVDERTAAHWFKLSASKSHAESIWMLSQMAGLIHQTELELQYQKTAASLGHVLSMRVLGRKYLKQLDVAFLNALVQQEYLQEALKYLHMAGDAGDTESLVLLGKTYNSCTKTKIQFSATNMHQHHNLPTPSSTHDSFCDGDDNDDDEENESRFQCQEDEKNLAIECFEKAAMLGDMEATVYAAEAWYEQKQYAAALEYFEKAASQGSVLARFFCARYCIEGYGGSQLNPEKGFQELLICATELNCVHAYNTLAQCYENGIGTVKNDQLAYEWYARAAETTRDAEAFYRIAQMYAQERIATESADKDVEACKFYSLAVNATADNHGPSCYQLGLYYLNGIPSSLDTTLFLLPPDVCLSIEYLRTAADLNVQEAMLQLGVLFLNDDYSLQEQEEGLARLQHAAQLGLREAQFELGLFYHRGKEILVSNLQEEDDDECVIIPQDFEKAYDLFCRSAVQKHPTATFYLGIYHQHGIFVVPDLAVALEQFELAVQLFEKYKTAPDRWQAEFNLARILHHHVQSRTRAYELFQAAHLDAPQEYKFLSEIMIARYHLHGWANVTLQAEEAAATLIRFAHEETYGYRVYLQVGQCFELGLGVEKNLRQAFHWYGQVVSKAHLMDQQQSLDILPMMLLLDEETEEDEASAMFKLAEFYRQGVVVSKDTKKADDLYRLAARKGSQAAQDHLSFMA